MGNGMKHIQAPDYYRVQERRATDRYWWYRRFASGRAVADIPRIVLIWMVWTFPRPRRPWLRTWQAEWEGCERAVRAYTRRGLRSKTVRRMGGR